MSGVTLPPRRVDRDAPWRLSWGSGPVVVEPWHHSDIRWWPGMEFDRDPEVTTWDHVGPIAAGLPWDQETFGGIVANHSLQMLPWPELVPALAELYRVLAPRGVLRLLVPDVLRAVGALVHRDPAHFQIADEHESSIDGKFCMYLTQAGATRSVFTRAWLTELLRRAGFVDVEVCAPGVTILGPAWIVELDSRPDESIVIEAR